MYSVLRFVPDSTRGEFVNIGAIVGSDELEEWELRTVENLRRARRIDENHILHKVFSIINDIGGEFDQFLEASEESIPSPVRIDEKWLQQFYEDSLNVIQLSKPAPLLADDISLAMQRVFDEFIVDPAYKKMRVITKQAAFSSIKSAYSKNNISGSNLIERAALITKRQSGQLDFVVANSRALQLTQAWSFQIQGHDDLYEQIKSWAWTIHDLRLSGGSVKSNDSEIKISPEVKIDIVYVPPENGEESNVFKEAKYAFQELNAEMIEYENVSIVAERAARLLKKEK